MTPEEARVLVCPIPLPDEKWDAGLAAVAAAAADEVESLDKEPAWKLVQARWAASAYNLRQRLGHKHAAAKHAANQGSLRGYTVLMGLPQERVLEGRAAEKWLRKEAEREAQREREGREKIAHMPTLPRSLREAEFRLSRRRQVLQLVEQPGWQRLAVHMAAAAWAAYRSLEWCTADERAYYQGIITAARAAVKQLVEDVSLGNAAERWLATAKPKEQGMAKEAGNGNA